MSAPEIPLVIRLDVKPAAPRRERQLEIQVHNAHMQLDAVISVITAQALFAWIGLQERPVTDEEIAKREREIRAEWCRIALSATNRKGPGR